MRILTEKTNRVAAATGEKGRNHSTPPQEKRAPHQRKISNERMTSDRRREKIAREENPLLSIRTADTARPNVEIPAKERASERSLTIKTPLPINAILQAKKTVDMARRSEEALKRT